MATRLEVELTSVREDGTWTWRAAGARQPRGVVAGSLVYEGAKVGDVVRAEAEFELDGIVLTYLHPPKPKEEPTGRLEVAGRPADHAGQVTATLVGKGRRPEREAARAREGARRAHGRPEGPPRRGEARVARSRPQGSGEGAGQPPQREASRPQEDARGGKARPRRLVPGNVHRKALMASLSAEQVPIAEQLMRGGLPAVRQAVDEQNEAARRGQGTPVNAEAVMAIAEELLPRVRAATWRDRADAALANLDGLSLRDLRSVVVGAEAAARDEESRLLAGTLREELNRRVSRLRQAWTASIAKALADGKVAKALQLSARPPEPGARISAEMARALSEAASAALGPQAAPQQWIATLEAVADSPVRRLVKPAGLPENAGPEVLAAARALAGQVPALAKLLGLAIPPPPAPAGGRRPRQVVISRPPGAAGRPAADPEGKGGSPPGQGPAGQQRPRAEAGPGPAPADGAPGPAATRADDRASLAASADGVRGS
jgi:hypothetical protein